MIHNAIILFCILPLAGGLLCVPLVNRPRLSRAVGLATLAAVLGLAVWLIVTHLWHGHVLVSQSGNWPAPYGISLVFDSLSGLLVATASVVALASYIHSFISLTPGVERRYYHPLMMLLMFGVNLSFLTGDLFNLFVAFEIMLMASYALVALGSSKLQLRQAYKYVLLNLLASTVFVMAAGMVYGLMGTLNMADLARIVAERRAAGLPMPAGFTALAVCLLFVFGLKGAFFPLWFWLPDTYYTAPIAIAGLFGGMLTKVGVYAVARTFPTIFAAWGSGGEPAVSAGVMATIIAVAAGFTMLLAVLGAVSQHHVRRILSVHVISQVGYMVFGIAVGVSVYSAGRDVPAGVGAAAMAGCVFYMIQHMVVKCSLFLCCGMIEAHGGTDDLNKLGGLLKRDTTLAVLFFVAAMSLVGLPPLSGFFGKLTIIQAGWHGYWWLSIIGLLTGALTLLSMLKIWSYAFWNPPRGEEAPDLHPGLARDHQAPHVNAGLSAGEVKKMHAGYLAIAMLVAVALFLGFAANPVYVIANHAGRQLIDPREYVEAVLGPEAWAGVEENQRLAAKRSGASRLAAERSGASSLPSIKTAPGQVEAEDTPLRFVAKQPY